MKKTLLKNFAKLIVKSGITLVPGQNVVIRADLDQSEFVMMVVEECYKAGAKKVEVEWDVQKLSKIHYNYRTLDVLSTVEKWEEERLSLRANTLPCMIYLLSEDPDGMDGIDREKYAKASQARYKIIKPYRDKMENRYQWCIAAVPGEAWAKKMFPNLTKKQAIEKLWEAILKTSRADGPDPISAWQEHNRNIREKCDYLNSLNIRTLEYSSSNGTKLTVGLCDGSAFMGGCETTLSGNPFNANIPSEEVFTSPKKGEAEGIVYSTRPLAYNGEMIENFSIRFEKGKAVEVHAEKNEELLKQLISMDEGAAYLGECALVPFDSPIQNSGLIFYNTLFDENASCHLALGAGYTNTLADYEKLTLEECHKRGINDSMVHEDFMIGTPDLLVVGVTANGERIKIFENGNWAF
ncbi:MAG: aminopeptidase [Clostridia bacterium]|nr:aminopeptidase [Clostridia bacterium]